MNPKIKIEIEDLTNDSTIGQPGRPWFFGTLSDENGKELYEMNGRSLNAVATKLVWMYNNKV